MLKFEALRNSDAHFECIQTNNEGKPVAHVSGYPTDGTNTRILSQHCSIVPGLGIKLIERVWNTVRVRDDVDYIFGGYTPTNKGAKRIWDLCTELIGDEGQCVQHPHVLVDNFIKPVSPSPALFIEAFSREDYKIKKFLALFSRPTGHRASEPKDMEAVIFKVCDGVKEKVKAIWK
jgi:hypothetical protein